MGSIDLELYWMRHGEAVTNLLDTFSGRSNEAVLTPRGIEQSKKLGYFLAKLGIFPSSVYVSPAIRAIQTAEYCLAEMGLNIEPLIHDALQELDQGEWVGKNRLEMWNSAAVLAEIERVGKDLKQGGAESINDAALRGLGWIAETFDTHILESLPDRKFIFSHGAIISSMASQIRNWSFAETRAQMPPNGSDTLFVRHNGQWELEHFGRESE
jgi:broad specificity phosphatase PhoE